MAYQRSDPVSQSLVESGLFSRLHEGLSRLQQHDLKSMVEMEDYGMFRDMGTDSLLRMLSSDIRQGITTVKRDIGAHLETDIAEAPARDVRVFSLAERRRAYGENEARVWDIRQSVSQAWRPVVSISFLLLM